MEDTQSQTSEFRELFHDEEAKSKKPWWKTHFFVRDPLLFGTWDGVFTSCLINIFGVVLFLRTGWMVGNVGVGLSVLIVFLTITVALLAALAAIGICERLKDVHSGGVYFVVSYVLGGKIGGTVGVMYAFGLCIVSALYCTGFAESIASTFDWTNTWAVRGVAIATLLMLLGINLAGVKWVIRLQLILLVVLIVSTSDFIIGTMVHTDPDAGFVGFSSAVLSNNTYPLYNPGENFFTVFGVFFPTATGVMAGVNMSGDLKKPNRSIPIGTLSAIFLSLMLYLLFVLLLASTCRRSALQNDFMIAEKVSAVSFLWLAGLYMSSTSSCSTGLYGAPRVLQSIANQNVVPVIKILGKGFGPNKTPILAICVVGFISLLFILIGNLNAISPMITCNFMLVYAVVDYAYFALSMTYDLRMKSIEKYSVGYSKSTDRTKLQKTTYGSFRSEHPSGTMIEFSKDLDKLFQNNEPMAEVSETNPKVKNDQNGHDNDHDFLRESFRLDGIDATKSDEGLDTQQAQGDYPNTENASDSSPLQDSQPSHEQNERNEDQVINDFIVNSDGPVGESPEQLEYGQEYQEILRQPKTWYSRLCNRWLSLFGVLLCLVVMFLINWMYSLMNILAFALVYIYISQASPGLNPGVTNEFSLESWIRNSVRNCCRSSPPPPEQVVLAPLPIVPVVTVPEQLTADNEDFASRSRYHQAQTEDHDYASILPIMSTVPP